MKETEPIITEAHSTDSLDDALSQLAEQRKSNLFWDELGKLERSQLGENPRFTQGIKLIRKRAWLGQQEEDMVGTIAPLYMAEVGEKIDSGIEAERLQSWVVNHIMDQINSKDRT